MKNLVNALWVKICLPLWLLWRGPRVHAIIAWDPYASGLVGVTLKLLLHTKLILHIVGDYHKLEPSDELLGHDGQLKPSGSAVKKRLMRLAFRMSLSCSDVVKVVNSSLEEFVTQHYPAKPLNRFPCFVATEYFQSLEHHKGDYLLAVGYPFHRKGIDVLIQAFRLISDRHPTISLRIIGHASEGEVKRYKQLAEGNPRVEFIKPGWIEEVGEQLRGCYALVHPARSDAAPRVLFEAMACRKPIVATRTSGGIDYVQDGHTGLLCEIEDVQGLADKLDELLSNPERARQMGQAGFNQLQREFSEEKYISAFLGILESIVSKHQRSEHKAVLAPGTKSH
jgi:glycosyltransferase involved in cell wall biosynthesis